MTDQGYVRALERARFIMGPPRIKGMVVWSDAGLQSVRLLVDAFVSLVGERHRATVLEHGFLADGPAYREVFGGYANVYEVAADLGIHHESLLRPDNLVTTLQRMRTAGTDVPYIAVGGLLRRFDGRTPPLFRDRFIWPAVQLTQRVRPDRAVETLDFYRVVVERLLALAGLPALTVRTPALADYGRVTYLVISALPNGRPTVLATLYLLADGLRHALGEELDVVDVGLTGKVLATVAMLHRDSRGLVLPAALAPVQLSVIRGPRTEPAPAARWLDALGERGIRVRTGPVAPTRSRRDRTERGWHALGVPLVVGLDRHRTGEVIRAVRRPLTRTPLPGLPGPDDVCGDLARHDGRLLRAGRATLRSSLDAGGNVRAACPACAESLAVFGTVVPARRARCATCPAMGDVVFVSDEGRFY